MQIEEKTCNCWSCGKKVETYRKRWGKYDSDWRTRNRNALKRGAMILCPECVKNENK